MNYLKSLIKNFIRFSVVIAPFVSGAVLSVNFDKFFPIAMTSQIKSIFPADIVKLLAGQSTISVDLINKIYMLFEIAMLSLTFTFVGDYCRKACMFFSNLCKDKKVIKVFEALKQDPTNIKEKHTLQKNQNIIRSFVKDIN